MDLNMNYMLPALGERRESSFGSIIEFIEDEDENTHSNPLPLLARCPEIQVPFPI